MPTSSSTSPFQTTTGRPLVSVTSGDDPAGNTRRALAAFDLSCARGKRVLLKPNAGRIAAPGEGITTEPRVVAAAIDAFVEAGALVSVGESPITGIKTFEALEATGIAAVARERGCRIIDLDERPAVEVLAPSGKAMQAFKVCAEVLDHDLIVSIPVMKVHMHTGVTLAVKNMKGCLWRRSKVDLHMLPRVEGINERPLDIAIADMSCVLRPHLSIIDGTVGMEGLGPSAGTPKRLGVVVVGGDAFAADAVACRLMGLTAEEVPHLRMGAERGAGIIDLKAIEVTPAGWEAWAGEFERAPKNLSIEFPRIRILDQNSCSACQSTVLLFLRRYAETIFDYFPDADKIDIAIGKSHTDVPPGTLCIGVCTAAHKEKGVFVPGCPPVGSAILDAIRRQAKGKQVPPPDSGLKA
jgi:uncharacterized protein (DUF362 family)